VTGVELSMRRQVKKKYQVVETEVATAYQMTHEQETTVVEEYWSQNDVGMYGYYKNKLVLGYKIKWRQLTMNLESMVS
jgi:hypothetical protein